MRLFPIALLLSLCLAGGTLRAGQLPREALLIDFNGSNPGEGGSLSPVNSEKTDPVLDEIKAKTVFNLPDSGLTPETSFPGAYTPTAGLGFVDDVKLQQRSRGGVRSPLLADEVLLTGLKPATFRLDLRPGKYRVTTYHHDVRWPSKGGLEVFVDGKVVGTLDHASKGKDPADEDVARVRFEINVPGTGPLEMSFVLHGDGEPGVPSFPINGVYVDPLP